ncbi:carbohydrate sulfotransferase 15-like isoform X1 [Apostichopus japonicus]|uniref:carbohydrate sulfotransferase 15-like isoform X1 n=1 Tax=Stichopus japonicus TaxID=307972 RepID=UPI003AB553A7
MVSKTQRASMITFGCLVLTVIWFVSYTLTWKVSKLHVAYPGSSLSNELLFRVPAIPLGRENNSCLVKDGESATKGPPKKQRIPKKRWERHFQQVLGRFPVNFSSEFRNPCWYEGTELQCVPYFYQLGSYKCGTTDLWDKLTQHPDVLPVAKEPHWWALRRLGYTDTPIHKDLVLHIRNETGQDDDSSVQWYLNLYKNQSVELIQKNPKLIFGDASISNLWGLGIYNWKEHFPNQTDPPIFLSDLIHAVQPTAKITVILRDPVEKLWTTYMLRRSVTQDSSTFDTYTNRLIKKAAKCESIHTPLYCAFTNEARPVSPLRNQKLYQGVFFLYLREWIEVFESKNIHVLRLEDWKSNQINELERLIKYLKLDRLPTETLTFIVSQSTTNVNKKARKRNMTMWQSTRKKLQKFYRPWNQHLSELLKDQKYRWDY